MWPSYAPTDLTHFLAEVHALRRESALTGHRLGACISWQLIPIHDHKIKFSAALSSYFECKDRTVTAPRCGHRAEVSCALARCPTASRPGTGSGRAARTRRRRRAWWLRRSKPSPSHGATFSWSRAVFRICRAYQVVFRHSWRFRPC